MSEFHLLRPVWLLALIPLALLILLLRNRRTQAGNLSTVCDARLLPYLLIDARKRSTLTPGQLIGLGGVLAILALTGPTWSRLEQPVYRNTASLVVLLDLSSSMNVADIEPSRLTRAKFKLLDILHRRKEGQTALIVYAAQPFVVTPLTDDSATIISLVGSLSAEIMPSQGSRPDLALKIALELLKQAGAVSGDLLFLTDGMEEQLLGNMLAERPRQYRVNILGIGTTEGGPVPHTDGGFVKDSDGNIVVVRFDQQQLKRIAAAGGGVYTPLSHDDRDIDYLLNAISSDRHLEHAEKSAHTSDSWREEGYWLILPLLPLAAFAFRRGYLMLLLVLLPMPQPTHALSWTDLWLRADQQAMRRFEQGDPQQAAKQFQDNDWRAAAHYHAGDYQQSLEGLEGSDNARNSYNRGNALAHLGRLPEAVTAYEQSLNLQPEDEDAKYNLELVKKLLQQQQQQQTNQQEPPEPNEDNNSKSQSGEQKQHDPQSMQEQQQPQQEAAETPQQQAQSEQNEQQNGTDTQEQAQAPQSLEQSEDKQPGYDLPTERDEAQRTQEEKSGQTGLNRPQEQEQEQELTRQWLQRIPDDPGGLLQRKFLYQYKQQYQGQRERQPW